ncbi:hypothetical protein [Paraburkholderia metrosideri]|nr:hypothetical protein [Paraburkholderia metrosideri]
MGLLLRAGCGGFEHKCSGNVRRRFSACATWFKIGNMVVDRVASTGTTQSYTQQAIENLSAQIVPGGLGGVTRGLPEAPYSSSTMLLGTYGGLVDSSRASYGGATALFGPSSGLAASQIDPSPAALADTGGSAENLLYAWDRGKQYGADGWNATKQFAHDMVGATSMDAARANGDAGNFGEAVVKGTQSFLEAGVTVFTLGTAASIKTGITALVNGGRAALASDLVGGGAPIFSSGGLLGSRMWASSVGTGAIGAVINGGSQFLQNGTINPVDVAVSFGTGAAGSLYGSFGWNVAVNAAGGAANTAINNVLYGKNDSIVAAGFTSGALSSLGYGIGKFSESWMSSTLKPTINTANWAATGIWSSSGWNLFRPNSTAVIGGTIAGGLGQEVLGPVIPSFPYGSGKK